MHKIVPCIIILPRLSFPIPLCRKPFFLSPENYSLSRQVLYKYNFQVACCRCSVSRFTDIRGLPDDIGDQDKHPDHNSSHDQDDTDDHDEARDQFDTHDHYDTHDEVDTHDLIDVDCLIELYHRNEYKQVRTISNLPSSPSKQSKRGKNQRLKDGSKLRMCVISEGSNDETVIVNNGEYRSDDPTLDGGEIRPDDRVDDLYDRVRDLESHVLALKRQLFSSSLKVSNQVAFF